MIRNRWYAILCSRELPRRGRGAPPPPGVWSGPAIPAIVMHTISRRHQ